MTLPSRNIEGLARIFVALGLQLNQDMQPFLYTLLCVLFSFSVWGEEIRVRLTVQTLDGTSKVQAYHYTNHWGRREVRLEADTLPRFGKVNPILGYGRDTDDDGNIDSWFMIDDEKGLVRYTLNSSMPWAHDAVEKQLFKLYKSSAGAHFAASYGAVFGFLMMSVSHGFASEKELWREMMDLEEFSLRLDRSMKRGELTREQWREAAALLGDGYSETIARFEKATGGDYWKLVAADMALWATGGIIVKGIVKVAKFVGRPISTTSVGQSTIRAVKKIMGGITDRARAQMTRFRLAAGVPVNAVAAGMFKQNFQRTMRALMSKNLFMRKMVPMVVRPAMALKKAAREWKYIAFMAGIQITTESFAHSSEVMSSSPTQFAKNVLTHPEIIQNVTYMTTDAYLMTAASLAIKPKGIRYATCGFIALGNSAITNFVIKGETDYKRVALDTGWEAIIGNAQVQLDLKALSHFETAAQKAKNPKLKLLGWAIVLVDQTAGFLGYSYATQAIQPDKEEKTQAPDIQLVPVLAEH